MVLAGESAAAGVTLPFWLAIGVAVIGVLAPVVTGWWVYHAAVRNTTAIQETAAAARALEASRSHRELILYAAQLVRSNDGPTREQGYAMLEGVASMPGLSRDDAELVQSLTRAVLRRRLDEARSMQQLEGRPPRFWQRAQRPTDEGS